MRRAVAAAGLSIALSFACAATQARAQQRPPAATNKAGAKTAADTPAVPSGMSYRTELDRTAVWVGDQFHYTITVDYTPAFEFVLDSLTRENVNMDPFPVIDVARKVTPLSNNRNRLVVDITLASFSLAQTDTKIPQISLYYFRRDQHAGAEQAAAESLTVPGPMIGQRTTLTPNPADIRDTASTIQWQSSRWVVPALGYAALTLLIAWFAWEAYLFIKNRKVEQGPDRSVSMNAVRARWASNVPSDFSHGQATMDFYDRSYQNLKEYVGYYLNSETMSLTAEEVTSEMQRLGADSGITQRVGKVLGACEAVRYSGDGTTTSPESARSMAQDVRELLTLTPKE